jgi:hypothetical protein
LGIIGIRGDAAVGEFGGAEGEGVPGEGWEEVELVIELLEGTLGAQGGADGAVEALDLDESLRSEMDVIRGEEVVDEQLLQGLDLQLGQA